MNPEKNTARVSPPGKPPSLLLASIILSFVVLISMGLAHSLRISENNRIREETKRTSQFIEDELRREIESYAMAVVRMSERWSFNGVPTKASWEAEAKLYVRHFPGMHVVQWIDPSMRIKWFIPYQGNEHLHRMNLSSFSNIKKALEIARDRRRPMITGSMVLGRGGKGFYIFSPIRKDGEFHGYFGAVLRSQKLFKILLANVAPKYHISILDQNGEEIFSRGLEMDSFGSGSFLQETKMEHRGATWYLKVSPSKALISDTHSALPVPVFAIGLIFAFVIAWALRSYQMARYRASRIAMYNEELNKEIIERKSAEHALGKSEQRFRELVENIREVFWVENVEGSELLYLSPACESIWGRSSQFFYENPTAWMESIHEDDRNRILRKLRRSQKEDSYSAEFRIVRPDGTIRWIRDRSVVIYEKRKRMRRVGISEDITLRKTMEEQLKEVNKAFESALEGVSQIDERGHYVSVNHAFSEMFGYPEKELVGLHWERTVELEDIETFRKGYEKMVLSGKSEIQVQGVRKDRTVFDAQIVMVKFYDGLKQFKGHYCFVTDITERKQRESLEVKSEFISMVSHELRTPLHAIKEGINVVLEDEAGELNQEQVEMLEISKRNVARLSRLINDVLDFQKLDAGAVELKLTQSDINEVMIEIQEIMDPIAKNKGLGLELDLDPKVPLMLFDHDLILQVLINIVNNAIKFTDEGKITIRTEWDAIKKRIAVETEDTGIGIDKKDIPKIFKTFGQLHNGSRKAPHGTGLGLAISKKIIDQHHGRIAVSSTLGQGSVFSFSLPVYTPVSGKAPRNETSTSSQEQSSRSKRVLVVDDESDVLKFVSLRLKQRGFVVTTATDGLEAIHRAHEDHPDLIFLDIKLPLMNGFEVARHLRTHEGLAKTPIVFATADSKSFMDHSEKAMQPGDDLILKPFEPDQLFQKIEKHLIS